MEEDRFVVKHYGRIDCKEIAKALHRTPIAIQNRAGKLGLHRKKKHPTWNPEEDEFIRSNYYKLTTQEIAEYLGRNHPSQIVARATKIGVVKRSGWTQEEESRLTDLFNQDLPAGKIAKTMGCTRERIKNKLRSMGLKKGKSAPWTEEEIETLKQVYKHRTVGEIMEFLPGRPRKGISRMIEILGLNQEWEKSERCRELREAFRQRLLGSNNHAWNPDREYIRLKRKVTYRYMNLLHNSLERIGMEKQTKSSQLLGYT